MGVRGLRDDANLMPAWNPTACDCTIDFPLAWGPILAIEATREPARVQFATGREVLVYRVPGEAHPGGFHRPPKEGCHA